MYVDKHRLFGGAHFLDWCNTRDYDKLALCFFSDFYNFFEKEDMIIHPVISAVYNTLTDISYDHLFPRTYIDGDHVVTPENFESSYHSKREKVLYLISKLRSLRGSLLFVISSHVKIPELVLIRLYNSICHFYSFSNSIALINLHVDEAIRGTEVLFSGGSNNFIWRKQIIANTSSDRAHIGDHVSWSAALDEFELDVLANESANPPIDELSINGF